MPRQVLDRVAVRVIIISVVVVAGWSTHSVHDAGNIFSHQQNLLQFEISVEKSADTKTLGRGIEDMHKKRLQRQILFFSKIYSQSIPEFQITNFQDRRLPNEPQNYAIKRSQMLRRMMEQDPSRHRKRVQVCPLMGQAGLPLGGCLYSYLRSSNLRSVTPKSDKPPTEARAPRPVTRKVYRARWPEYYFLGGALGRR